MIDRIKSSCNDVAYWEINEKDLRIFFWELVMSDWDFLFEMGSQGYSAEEIMDAAAVGYAPFETPNDEQFETSEADSINDTDDLI